MTTHMPDHDALAIAYLTGQANAQEVKIYKDLLETDEGFRTLVARVEIWLAPLNETVEDRAAPVGLLNSIMAEIEDSEAAILAQNKGRDAPSPQITPPSFSNAANDNRLKKWRGLAIAASAIAVMAVGSHFVSPSVPDAVDAQNYMALLSGSNQPELMAIIYNPKSGKVVARLSNISMPTTGDLELWLIREGEAAPVSLGVLDRVDTAGQVEFSIPKALQGGTDTLAVSLEASGGSTTGGPQGPILYTGEVTLF